MGLKLLREGFIFFFGGFSVVGFVWFLNRVLNIELNDVSIFLLGMAYGFTMRLILRKLEEYDKE